MARQYGYCYDENGKFTEMIPIDEKPIYEKQTFYREEQKEVVTEEKLCELHQSIEDGTYVPVEIAVPSPDTGKITQKKQSTILSMNSQQTSTTALIV